MHFRGQHETLRRNEAVIDRVSRLLLGLGFISGLAAVGLQLASILFSTANIAELARGHDDPDLSGLALVIHDIWAPANWALSLGMVFLPLASFTVATLASGKRAERACRRGVWLSIVALAVVVSAAVLPAIVLWRLPLVADAFHTWQAVIPRADAVSIHVTGENWLRGAALVPLALGAACLALGRRALRGGASAVVFLGVIASLLPSYVTAFLMSTHSCDRPPRLDERWSLGLGAIGLLAPVLIGVVLEVALRRRGPTEADLKPHEGD